MRLLIDRLLDRQRHIGYCHRSLTAAQVDTVDRRGCSPPSYEERCFIAIEPRIACVRPPNGRHLIAAPRHSRSAT